MVTSPRPPHHPPGRPMLANSLQSAARPVEMDALGAAAITSAVPVARTAQRVSWQEASFVVAQHSHTPTLELDGEGEEHDRQGRSIGHGQGAPIWIEDRHRRRPMPPSTTRTRRVAYRMLTSATKATATSSGVPTGAEVRSRDHLSNRLPVTGPRDIDQPRCDRMHPDLGSEHDGEHPAQVVEDRLGQLDELVSRATRLS